MQLDYSSSPYPTTLDVEPTKKAQKSIKRRTFVGNSLNSPNLAVFFQTGTKSKSRVGLSTERETGCNVKIEEAFQYYVRPSTTE